ncbi:MAG: ABC transporter substrate-binding protein [Mobilitalea sp.]
MKSKKFLVVLLSIVMITSMLGGCAGKSEDTTEATDTTGSEDTGAAASTETEEPYTVVFGYIGDTYSDETKIEEEINKIIEPELNAKIDLRAYSWGTYAQELQLTLSGDENLDIVPIIVMNSASYVSNGQVIDLTELIDKYGTNIKKYVDKDFLTCPNIGGFVYGVTSMREQITWEGALLRADILEELGYTVEDNMCNEITSLTDLGEVYAKVKAAYPDMIMLGSAASSSPLFRWETADFLVDGYGALMNFGQTTEVVNLYETQEFKDFANMMYDWNKKGYISKDAATTTETLINQMKAGNTFSYMTPLKAGAVEQDELNSAQDLAAVSLYGDPYITSYSVNFLTWGIARNSTNPDKAMQVLDYIYGSPEVMNLMNWGVKDTNYTFVDEAKGIIGYPEGVDVNNKTWGLNIGWELPNQEIAYVWDGEDPSKWDLQREYIDKALLSKALGFSYDSTNVSNQLTALSNVKTEYYDAIGTGLIDPATSIDDFNKALYDAGLQDVIDEKQKQLDAWLATK